MLSLPIKNKQSKKNLHQTKIGLSDKWLLPIVLAFFPFHKHVLQVEISVVTLNPYVIGMLILTIISLVNLTSRGHRYNLNATDVFVALLALAYLVSTILSDSILKSGYLAFNSLFTPIISYFSIKTLVKNEIGFRRAFFSMIAGIVIFSFFEIYNYIVSHMRQVILSIPPIGYSTMSATGILFLFYSGFWRRKYGLLSQSILIVGFFATLSRAYLAALLVTPIMYKIIRRKGAVILLLGVVILTLAITVWLATSYKYFHVPESQAVRGAEVRGIERVTNINIWKDTIYTRGLHFREGIKVFQEKPFWGHGMQVGEGYITWHNFHIEWLVFGGFVGYVLYFSFLLGHFASIRKIAAADNISAALALAILVILINSWTNGIMHGMMPYMVFILTGFGEARKRFLTEK